MGDCQGGGDSPLTLDSIAFVKMLYKWIFHPLHQFTPHIVKTPIKIRKSVFSPPSAGETQTHSIFLSVFKGY